MEYLWYRERPELRRPALVVTFAGWANAAEAASRALQYLVRKLSARKFAGINPEEFYDFTAVRPLVKASPTGERLMHWPANDFYYWKGPEAGRDLVFFLGVEPNLKWVTFSELMMEVAGGCGAELMMAVGSVLDAIPHTWEPRVSGTSSSPELRQVLQGMGVSFSGYQGPTGIHSALYEACERHRLPWASLWGHSPHYLQGVPNLKVSHALLRHLTALLGFSLDLEELRQAWASFEETLDKLLARRPEVQAYIKKLEELIPGALPPPPPEPFPSPETLVRELEEFLRKQREKGEGGT